MVASIRLKAWWRLFRCVPHGDDLRSEEVMYELVAVSHSGVTPEVLSGIRMPRMRTKIAEWDAAGSRAPIRVMASTSPEPLREMQKELLEVGIQTQIRRVLTTETGTHRVTGPQVVYTPPPTNELEAVRSTTSVSEESGIHEFRLMMAEMDQERESRAHKVAASIGLRPVHFIVIAILALIGLLFSIAF